jgi:hypothetical protein
MDAQHPNGTRHHELDVEGVVDPTRVDRSVLSTLWDGQVRIAPRQVDVRGDCFT